MTFSFHEGPNPASRGRSAEDAFSNIMSRVHTRIGQHQQEQENIRQGGLLHTALSNLPNQDDEHTQALKQFALAQMKGLSPQIREKQEEQFGKQHIERQKIKQEQQKVQNSSLKADPAVQKWAYDQIGKSDAVNALKRSINTLRKENDKGYSGPVAGRTPTLLQDKDVNATLKKMDVEGVQLLNVHKTMFPRGLTTPEFINLGNKVAGSNNTKEANSKILDTYESLANLQDKKIQAVDQAVKQYGFDPQLPFIVRDIQKQFDAEEERINQEMYQSLTGEKPEQYAGNDYSSGQGEGAQSPGHPEDMRSQNEKVFSIRNRKTGEIIPDVPLEHMEEARNHPDYEVLNSERDVSPKTGKFGETEKEADERRAEQRRLARKKR